MYIATVAQSFSAILSQILLSYEFLAKPVEEESIAKYNALVATFLYGSEDVMMSDIIDFVNKFEFTPDPKSIVDYHIWLLKQQPSDHKPQRTVETQKITPESV